MRRSECWLAAGLRDLHRNRSGLTFIELLVSLSLTAVLAGSMAALVGAAVRSKVITAARSADTETARQTLEWMADRLRNAGLNLRPSAQPQLRCKDMVVAQDAALRPTANSLHVSGEILNTDTTAGNQVETVGYLLGSDPVSGTQIVMEYRNPCSGGSATTTPLSDPRVTVTSFSFTYFSSSGTQITDLTNVTQIRLIRTVRISLTVQKSEGTSGVQSSTLTRDVLLRNPEPNANDWVNLNENI